MKYYNDMVYHPSHYCNDDADGIEAIDIIEFICEPLDGKSALLLGNVLKYALRAGKKDDALQDLHKARNYAHRLVNGEWYPNN